jgi:hypothetical protein
MLFCFGFVLLPSLHLSCVMLHGLADDEIDDVLYVRIVVVLLCLFFVVCVFI